MAKKKDYYEVLGVPRTADEKRIKTAYRALAMKYHPDRLKDGTSDQKMQELNEAYEVLSDKTKKANYDKYGSPDGPQPGFGFNPGNMNMSGGFGDFAQNIFENIFNFGNFTSSSSSSRSARKVKGDDIVSEIVISFSEAINGKEIKEKLTKYELCKKCNGSGANSPEDIKTCPVCRGSGQREVIQRTPIGIIKQVTTCDKCNGTGKIIVNICRECGGHLYIKKLKNVTFKIPEGSNNGDKIKLEGFGEKGHNGAPSGDMYVIVNVKPHKYFRRDNLNLYLDFPVSFIDIVKENSVKVPTPYGYERIKLKNSYQTGKVLNLSGKGVKSSAGVGDLKIKLQVVMPDLSDDQYNEMAKDLEPYEDNVNIEFTKLFDSEK